MLLLEDATDTSTLAYVKLDPGMYVLSLEVVGGFAAAAAATCKFKIHRGSSADDSADAYYLQENGSDLILSETNPEVCYRCNGVWIAAEESDFDGGTVNVRASKTLLHS